MENKKKILIIDDEEDICAFSKSALERTGKFSVFTSTKASEGLQIAKTEIPDLILLDVNMPEMDGGAVAQSLTEFNATKNIPVIFLTALLKKEELLQASGKINRHFFLAKPVSPKELTEKIESVLSQ